MNKIIRSILIKISYHDFTEIGITTTKMTRKKRDLTTGVTKLAESVSTAAITVTIERIVTIEKTAGTDAITEETRKIGIKNANSVTIEATDHLVVTSLQEIELKDLTMTNAQRKASNPKTAEESGRAALPPTNREANSPKFNIRNYPNHFPWILRSQILLSILVRNTKYPLRG